MIMHALGVGRAAEQPPARPCDVHLFRSVRLKPWRARMRFGRVLSWDGPWYSNAVGIAGPDWDGGNWLGGMSWKRYGPLVVCRHRRRGSWRGDRISARLAARAAAYEAAYEAARESAAG